MKAKVQQKKAELVEQFNQLRDEQRYAEMEIVARRLIELAPDDPVAQQVWRTAKFIRRDDHQSRREGLTKKTATGRRLNDVEKSSIANVGDGHEMVYDQKHWDDFVEEAQSAREIGPSAAPSASWKSSAG